MQGSRHCASFAAPRPAAPPERSRDVGARSVSGQPQARLREKAVVTGSSSSDVEVVCSGGI
eukprot:1004724-Alexandrium_andersonii.AAC.1